MSYFFIYVYLRLMYNVTKISIICATDCISVLKWIDWLFICMAIYLCTDSVFFPVELIDTVIWSPMDLILVCIIFVLFDSLLLGYKYIHSKYW